MEKRRELIQKLKMASEDENQKKKNEEELIKVEDEISNISSEENRNKVVENLQSFANTDGSTNNMGVWNIKKKIFPKNTKSLPFAKKNFHGKIISTKNELKQLYLDTYTHRLRHRPIRDDLLYLKSIKEELCFKRLEIAKNRKSERWTRQNLLKVLKSLKNGKSRDPHGIISEIFKPEVAGQDFQNSLLILLNKVKDELRIPDFMELANIVSIYKGKGEKMDLENDRGIFIVNKFRDILMKLSYQDKYEVVDRSMSDSNVGGRKNKNIRNHIFVVNSVINEVIQNKKKSIDIEFWITRNALIPCGWKNV